MTRVLITGGAGFVGFHLAKKLLAEDYQVDLLDNLSRGVVDRALTMLAANPRARLLNRDLMQVEACKDLRSDYRYIYHLAAIIGVGNVLKNPYAVMHDNFAMLINLLEFARKQASVRRVVFFSTSEVYAGTLKFFELPIPTPESVPLALTELSHSRSSYMISKIYGEALCQQVGVPFTIVRPHNLYGPRMGMAHVIPELLNRAYHADDGRLDVFSVEHSRTFCYITDGIEMIKRAAESHACTGETLNIGNQAPEITIGQLADIVLRVMSKELKVVAQPATSGSPLRRCPDMTKTIKLTEYLPKIGLEEGVGLTYDWYKTHVFSNNGVTAK